MHQAIGRSTYPRTPPSITNKITPHTPRPHVFHLAQTNIPENKKNAHLRETKNGMKKESGKQRIASKGKKRKRICTLFIILYIVYCLYLYSALYFL